MNCSIIKIEFTFSNYFGYEFSKYTIIIRRQAMRASPKLYIFSDNDITGLIYVRKPRIIYEIVRSVSTPNLIYIKSIVISSLFPRHVGDGNELD